MRIDRGTAAVSGALQRYAARGVFRGFSMRPERGGRRDFRFTWLTRQPTVISYDRKAHALTFRRLLPAAGSYPGLSGELKRVVDEHKGPAVPQHRRIDARRVRLGCALRRGDFSLTLAVRGPHHAYAVQRGLNLVNQIFLLLQASYPEYLIECFGFSSE
jgi:hypothetical protein